MLLVICSMLILGSFRGSVSSPLDLFRFPDSEGVGDGDTVWIAWSML